MKVAAYIGPVIGVILLGVLVDQADISSMARVLATGGADLLWLLPYRGIFLTLYGLGWFILLQPSDPGHRAPLFYVLWVTAVRDAVDRLLPVASVGGGVVGTRLLGFCGIATSAVGATVIVEVLLTLIALYLFTGLGLCLLIESLSAHAYRQVLWLFVLTLPVPIVTTLLLRHGAPLRLIAGILRRLLPEAALCDGAEALNHELGAVLRRGRRLVTAGGLQCMALLSGSFEVWLALRLFAHPVAVKEAVMIESLTQAARHLAFMVPAGIGAQEAGLMLAGHALGIATELTLALSMVKRMREVLWGLPSLISWQWLEGAQLQRTARNGS